MATKTSISIILPVYNEEMRIEKSIDRLLSYCKEKGWDFELIFAHDKSTDNTRSILERLSLSNNRIKILDFPIRLGKGGAIISAVLSLPLKEYVAYMDIDLSADPCELENLLECVNNYDVVIGSRILGRDIRFTKRPFHRSILSNSYSRVFRTLFRISILDPQCGLKLFRREKIKELFEAIEIPDFAFDTDLIVTAFAQSLRVKEVPVNWIYASASKVRILHEIQSMAMDMLSIWYRFHLLWRQNKATYPQKKGSIYGRLLFALLSFTSIMNKRTLNHAKLKLLNTNLNQNIIIDK
jgi:glycosyltransferase involved in cell wall biosynthesis